MVTENPTLRFADQDDRTLSLLAHVQRETGYVPTMDELCQLLQCPTTAAARQRLDEMVTSGEGTRLTPSEQQEVAEIAERLQQNATPCPQQRQPPDAHHRRHTHMTGRTHVRWARPG